MRSHNILSKLVFYWEEPFSLPHVRYEYDCGAKWFNWQ